MAKQDKNTEKPDAGSGSVSERLQSEQAAAAYRKVMAGDKLTRQEQSDLRRFEKEKEERLRWQHYRSIPQKHWREMSGRQAKVLYEQAERYGIPFGDRVIDLPRVVRALHDFFKRNGQKLAADADALLSGESSPALERYREERAALARMDRLEREQTLVNRAAVRESLGRIAAILRAAGDTLQRQCGPEALEILNDALLDAEREIEQVYGVKGDETDSDSQPP